MPRLGFLSDPLPPLSRSLVVGRFCPNPADLLGLGSGDEFNIAEKGSEMLQIKPRGKK